jgi:hypothetical protein
VRCRALPPRALAFFFEADSAAPPRAARVTCWTNCHPTHLRPFATSAAIACAGVEMVIEHVDDARLRERRLYTGITEREPT